MHTDWLVPAWPAPARVHAICTTRAGGQSRAPYDSLNLGEHVGDAPADVAANRLLLGAALHARPVFLQQVHGIHALALDAATPHGSEADACVTSTPGIACTIMVADCLPVLLTDLRGTAVGAAHAGWRGLCNGVIGSVLDRMNLQAKETLAWLGPCIGPQAFEVGDEVRDAFVAKDTEAQTLFRPHAPGKWLADLQGLARLRLRARGVEAIHGNDGSAAWCTVSNPSRFFSHRRDARSLGGTGRMAACIWLG